MRSVPTAHRPGGAPPARTSGARSASVDDDRLALQRRANADLVDQVLQDPRAGLAAMHDRFARDVNRLVWRLMGADADHDDLVQQVFFRILTSVHRLRDPERLEGWVRAVTVNTVRAELRRRSLRRLLWWQIPETNVHGDLAREVEARDLVYRSLEVLEKLPAQERIVFGLVHLEDLTLPEVAEACGFSLMTAKRRLAAARRRIEALVRTRPDLLERLRAGRGISS